jgi:YEATS domain-containing protein 4
VIDDVPPGGAFEVHETGWGEFEITIKMYYVPESQEKPQTVYHHLRLHPYGDTEAQKEEMRLQPTITSWIYEEQLFNEPYEHFYEILTSPVDRVKGGGKSTKTMRGGMVSSVGERTALIPLTNRPGQPFSRETEKLEMKRLRDAKEKVEEMTKEMQKELRDKEQELARLKQG